MTTSRRVSVPMSVTRTQQRLQLCKLKQNRKLMRWCRALDRLWKLKAHCCLCRCPQLQWRIPHRSRCRATRSSVDLPVAMHPLVLWMRVDCTCTWPWRHCAMCSQGELWPRP